MNGFSNIVTTPGDRGDSRVPLIGISEWFVFLGNYFVERDDPEVVDECVRDLLDPRG